MLDQLRFKFWVLRYKLRLCICGVDDDGLYLEEPSPTREHALEVTTEPYQLNGDQMDMARGRPHTRKETPAPSQQTTHINESQHVANGNRELTIRFNPHTTRWFREAVSHHHKVHKAAKHAKEDLEKLQTQLQYLRRRLFGLRLACMNELHDDPVMLPLAQHDMRMVVQRMDEIEDIKEKLQDTISAMYVGLHEGQAPLFKSLGYYMAIYGLMPQKFDARNGSVASTVSAIDEKQQHDSEPESFVTNPYSPIKPGRSCARVVAVRHDPMPQPGSAAATLHHPAGPTPSLHQDVRDESRTNAHNVSAGVPETVAKRHDDDEAGTLAKMFAHWPPASDRVSEARAAVGNMLRAKERYEDAEDTFDDWPNTAERFEKRRAAEIAAGKSNVSTRTQFERTMLKVRAARTRSLIEAENEFNDAKLYASEGFGIVMADAESDFGASWSEDGYGSVLDEAQELRAHFPVLAEKTERWLDAACAHLPEDAEHAPMPPPMDEWMGSDIAIGDSTSCVAAGKDKRRINNWQKRITGDCSCEQRRHSL